MDYSYELLKSISTLLSILALAYYIIVVAGFWKMFTKAGEAGWKAIIPIVNLYTIFKIVYGTGWKFLLLIVPVLNVILEIAFCIRLAHVYGKGTGFGILNLFFLPITACVIGFGSAEYSSPIESFL